MTKHCRLCDAKLETEEEKEKGICRDCLHQGFNELGQALARMKKKE
ncbi:MAG: hypothetical protein SV186_01045 [Candidatus Nanohaloarchaea archaeon]|nr:hypothetical protein [Candidatus Nanohaloarchaea archaeon]